MSNKSFAEVVDLSGNLIRTYDENLHGEKFAELAKTFALKNGYVVRGAKDTTTEVNAKKVAAQKEIEEAAKNIKEGKEFSFGGKTYSPESVEKMSEKAKKSLADKIEKKKQEFDKAVEAEANSQ